MNRLVYRTLGICVLFCASFSADFYGQSAAPDQGAAAAPASAAQASLPPKAAPEDNAYVIGEDDVLSINVWKEPDLTRSLPVRSDGKVSLPLVGDVQAAGLTPAQLRQVVTDDLRSYITDPQVTVIVQEIRSQKFNILGQVNKPGLYVLTAGTTIVDAIALAGGLRDFAKKKSVYILRSNPAGKEFKITFNYQDFIKGKNTDQNIRIKPHDTIVVP